MQRLSRAAAASLLQFHHRCCLQAVQAVQCCQPVAEGAQLAAEQLLASTRLLQVRPLHASVQQPSLHRSSRCSSSSCYYPQQHLLLSHNSWAHCHHSSFSNSSSSSSLRHFSSSSASAASRTPIPGLPRAKPAAKALATLEETKEAVGVCRRRQIKCGWKKIDFVLRMIRRATVDDAMAQLAASPKRAAVFVKHAVANARNNAICAGGDPERLYVAEAFVTKGRYTKRRHIMSKGFASIKETQYSHLNVRVQQYDDQQAAAALLRRRPRLVAPLMQRLHNRARMPRRLLVPGAAGSSSASQLAATA